MQKTVLWIYGGKKTGKTGFVRQFAAENKLSMREISDISNYKELEKYTENELVLFDYFKPEHCTPDLVQRLISDFKYNRGFFKNEICQYLVITSWYPPDRFYDISYNYFKKEIKISKTDFLKMFEIPKKSRLKIVYNFEKEKDKKLLVSTYSKIN